MARTKKVTKTTPDTKAEIIENSVQNVAAKPVLTATELKKQFVKPVVNEDGTPCAISELDRVVDETEAALNEVYDYYEDKTSETQAHVAAAESYALQAEQSRTAAAKSKTEAAVQAMDAQTYASRAESSASSALKSKAEAESSASFAASYEGGARLYNQGAQIANSEAKTAATAAKTSETNAAASEAEAKTAAQRAEVAAAETETLYHYRGTVQTYQDLPTNAVQGDTYNVIEAYGDFGTGTNFAWNGEVWDSLGGTFDTSNFAKLDSNNTFTGYNSFSNGITVTGNINDGGYILENGIYQTYYRRNYIHFNNGGSTFYDIYFPTNDGTIALTSDIPTDCATQAQLAQTNQNVEDLYTILEQAQIVTVTTIEQAYTTRETADGENIVDGVQTTVKEIKGATVATENLIPHPYNFTTGATGFGITATINTDNSVTLKGSWIDDGSGTRIFDFVLFSEKTFPAGTYTISGCPLGGATYTYRILVTVRDETDKPSYFLDAGSGATFPVPNNGKLTIFIRIGDEIGTVNNLVFRPMLNAGDTAKPYSKWFPGLKNAFFKEIVSTGRNLIPYPYFHDSRIINGVTFTVNKDGSVIANGTATARTVFNFVVDRSPIFLNKRELYTLSGCPSGGGDFKYRLYVQDTSYRDFYYDDGKGVTFKSIFTDYYVYLVIYKDYTVNNLVFRPKLSYGNTTLPYEPYTSDTLSAVNPIELSAYDVAYPATNETKRQSNTVVFDGTEAWQFINASYRAFFVNLSAPNNTPSICSNGYERVTAYIDLSNKKYIINANQISLNDEDYSTLEEWKAHLAALAAAGNPLTVTYKTAEATTEVTPFNKSKYLAWKNGSETIEQGSTDNSEYGAENTVKQDYFTLTGGTTNGQS